MNTTEKLIEARMLALAEQLTTVSAACRRPGISRSHYCEIKEAFEKFGCESLAPQTRRKPRMPNQTPPELEAQILEMTERYPPYSYLRISDQLKQSRCSGSVRKPQDPFRPTRGAGRDWTARA